MLDDRKFVTLCVVERNDTKKRVVYQAPSTAFITEGDTVQLTKNPASTTKVLAVNNAFVDTNEYKFVLAMSGAKEIPCIYAKSYLTVYEYDEAETEAAVNE